MIDFNFSSQVGKFHVVPYMPHVVHNVHFDYINSCLKSKQTYLILILVKLNVISHFKQMDLILHSSLSQYY